MCIHWHVALHSYLSRTRWLSVLVGEQVSGCKRACGAEDGWENGIHTHTHTNTHSLILNLRTAAFVLGGWSTHWRSLSSPTLPTLRPTHALVLGGQEHCSPPPWWKDGWTHEWMYRQTKKIGAGRKVGYLTWSQHLLNTASLTQMRSLMLVFIVKELIILAGLSNGKTKKSSTWGTYLEAELSSREPETTS